MKLAAKQVHNQLDWSVLDIEPAEWDRRMGDLGVAAVANGFPLYAAAQAGTNGQPNGPTADGLRRLGIGRHVVLVAAAAVVLAALIAYAVWRTAQEGIVRMQGDVVNVVKLEAVQARTQQPAFHRQESVQAVEFLDGDARAAVVVTYTLPSGKVMVQAETRFYKRTSTGWQRTEPVAAFWGSTETLDTESLHFVFGEKDRSVVEETAPTAQGLYVTLRRAIGQDLAADGLLTIEIVPGYVAGNAQVEDAHIWLTSPLLHRATALSGAEALTLLLRRALADQMLSAALPRMALKPQWLTMVQAFGSWLDFSDDVQPASDDQLAALRRLRFLAYGSLHLDALQDGVVRYDATAPSTQVNLQPDNPHVLEQRAAVAEQLIGFIATTYGIDVLPKLLQGYAQYDDWETLAPAVLGVSAAELEAAWHAARR
jgi:hypothetical protein